MVQPLRELAARGAYVGTSSWKYEGWLGQLYTPGRYQYRGKLARTRFERGCLEEYAEVFKTVCVDAAYYTFPRRDYLEGLAAQVPDDFRFGFKVTDEITVRNYPNIERFGLRAGHPNPNFLNAQLFATAFLLPCEAIRSKVGVLIFEFSRFAAKDYARGADFVTDLDRFLAALPGGWPYAIELRNRHWLTPEYFQCLARHGVAHTFNSWTAMPPVGEQMSLPGSRPNPALVAARMLLKPGRSYEAAVKAFAPYDRTREAAEDVRDAAADLIKESLRARRNGTFLYVNNRLEGSALNMIAAILARVLKHHPELCQPHGPDEAA